MVERELMRNTDVDHDEELDARGWNCPLPILHAIKVLDRLKTGQVLRVVATDPGSMVDFSAFTNQSKNTLLQAAETNGEFHYLIKKG